MPDKRSYHRKYQQPDIQPYFFAISPSSAIQLLYSQIALTRGLPLDLRLPSRRSAAVGGMSREELDAELMKGVETLKSGRVYTTDEVDAKLAGKLDNRG